MNAARLLVAAGFGVMLAALSWGFAAGDGWAEVRELADYPWFIVSLVDVYVGFALFCGWVIYRERSPLAAVAWVVAILLLGNLVACAYALLALLRCGGSWPAFWLGRHASPAARAS